jgi:DNA-binding transcriptional LysR family regulator
VGRLTGMDDAPGPHDPAADEAGETAGLAVAFVPGVMPGKWFFRWRDRNPGRVLAERPLETDAWQEELGAGRAHACFVRLPAHPRPGVDDLATLREEYRAVELYAEQQVVVLPRDHELTLLDEVPVAELVDEVLLQEPATLPERHRLRSPEAVAADAPLPPMRHARDAVELVAAGLGLVVVPMSLARLHHRKDVVAVPVADPGPGAEVSSVSLVWRRDLDDDRIQTFVGVVRGRTARSSRGSQEPSPSTPPSTPPTKPSPKQRTAKKRAVGGRSTAPRSGSGRRHRRGGAR